MFADVPQITEKLDVIFDVVEKLRPTLDLNDAETLKQSVSNLNDKMNRVTAAAEQHQHQMQTIAQSWREYQVSTAFIEILYRSTEEQILRKYQESTAFIEILYRSTEEQILRKY